MRGTLYLLNVRMEYSVPKGYVYPKVLPQFSNHESLNKKLASVGDEKSPSENDLNMFSIRLISNLKFTEMFTSVESQFVT